MTKLEPSKIKYAILHHTATSRDRTSFYSVKNYHIGLGWSDIAYHWFIDGAGKLWKGRDEQWIGSHANSIKDGLSMNFQSIGISLTGNFEIEQPSKEQILTLDTLLDDIRKRYNIDRKNVLGHFEIPATATLCPGRNFMPSIRTYRQRIEPPKPTEPTTDKQDIKNQIIKLLEKL